MSQKLATHVYDPNMTPLLSEDIVKLIRTRIRTGRDRSQMR